MGTSMEGSLQKTLHRNGLQTHVWTKIVSVLIIHVKMKTAHYKQGLKHFTPTNHSALRTKLSNMNVPSIEVISCVIWLENFITQRKKLLKEINL